MIWIGEEEGKGAFTETYFKPSNTPLPPYINLLTNKLNPFGKTLTLGDPNSMGYFLCRAVLTFT